MSQDLFDFGFTAVDENELEAVQKEQQLSLIHILTLPTNREV